MSNGNEKPGYESKAFRYKDGKATAGTILVTRFNGEGVSHLDDDEGFRGRYCVYTLISPGKLHSDYDPRRFINGGPFNYSQDIVEFLRNMKTDDSQWELLDEGMVIHRDDFRDGTHVEGE